MKQKIKEVLKEIPDPELGISLWDLGLIYDIKIKVKHVKVVMTLTTMGCPLFSLMAESIKQKLEALEGVEEVEVELTFDPPWDTEKMSDSAKKELGFV